MLKDHKPTERLENISAPRQRRLNPTRHPASERNSIVADATGGTIQARHGVQPAAKLKRRAAAEEHAAISFIDSSNCPISLTGGEICKHSGKTCATARECYAKSPGSL